MSDRKSRRRSSLAATRIQLQYGKNENNSSEELYKMIGNDKTEEERLAALHRICLEYTLQKLEEENLNMEGLQDLKKELRDQGLRKITELEENGSFKQACNNDRVLEENPGNLEMDVIIDAVVSYNKRLVAESKQWGMLLKDSSKAVADLEAMKPDKLPPVVVKDQDIVDGYLPEPMDTISVCNKFRETVADVNHTVEKFSKTVAVIQMLQRQSENLLKEKSDKLRVESFAGTPRTIIQKIITGLQTPKS